MIIIGGFNIFPKEIEDYQNDHPAVVDFYIMLPFLILGTARSSMG